MSHAPQPLFKNIAKRVNDLLTKDFPSDKREQKTEWKSATSDGLKLEFSIKSEEGRDGTKTVGTVKDEYYYAPWHSTFTGELNTDREFKGEVAIGDKFVKGLKTIFTAQSQNRNGLDYFGIVGLEYQHEYASATVSAEFGRATDNAVKASLVVGSQGLSVGANVETIRKESSTDLKEFKVAATYASEEFDITGHGKVTHTAKTSTSELGASYYHKINSDLAVGTEIKFDVSNPDKKPALAFGAQYKLQHDSTLKARFDTEGKLGLSLAQQINKSVKLLISSTIDTNGPSGKNGSAFGFTLSLNP
jgi:hypothetical protein